MVRRLRFSSVLCQASPNFPDDEGTLETEALCCGRDHLKKSMPSMSIQASVIQTRRPLCRRRPGRA
jgi:hypothetical protein